ncbi:MAG: PVC-type heme-binding CxxCH protein [Planctomycetaceae bacterium]
MTSKSLYGALLLASFGVVASALAEEAPAPLPAQEAADKFAAPDNFRVTLFAGEPDIVQPIAMTTDGRGRLWVVECLSYPQWSFDGTGHDRVTILEDTDGDGRHDVRKVFLDNGSNLSGIAWGLGGIWLCSIPNVVFIPDRNGDDVPDGPAEVVLDGWNTKTRHNVVNGLQFGPDGWLYGCNGIQSDSLVGPPGTPAEQRTALNCAVWRYHPTRKTFEVVASGTTNPWGFDFDAKGRMFITNCVIEHVFEIVPGGHYRRMYGEDLTPNTYKLMETCADHIHWGGGFWDISIGGVHNEFGGGHAHSGAMIYLGDDWPEEYRGNLFTLNIHGQRLNRDTFSEHGSGVVASHAADFAQSHDPWFRGVELMYGADGGVFVMDWNDTGECHDYEIVARDTGRIFKIKYRTPGARDSDLTKLDDQILVGLQFDPNEWQVRMSRLILQERAAQRAIEPVAVQTLQYSLQTPDPLLRLKALWTLHCIGALDTKLRDTALRDPDPQIRAWTIRLEAESGELARDRRGQFAELAKTDPSPVVRLELASVLQRLPNADRARLAGELLQHEEDAGDRQIPLMLWYGIMPLAGDAEGRDLALLGSCRIPLTGSLLSRRIAALDGGIDRLVDWLAAHETDAAALQGALLGLRDAVEGRRGLKMPRAWSKVAARALDPAAAATRATAQYLALAFGDQSVFDTLRTIAAESSQSTEQRLAALELLIQVPSAELVPLLQKLVAQPELAGPALRGLAAFDDPKSAAAIIAAYNMFTATQRDEAVATLAARADFAAALLEAIAAGQIPPADVPAYTARQLLDLGNEQIANRVRQLWGHVRTSPAEKQQTMAAYRTELASDHLAAADLKAGRALFKNKCAQCHKLYGEGASIGPDLTGSQRTSLDYLLQHVVDPGAVVPNEYKVYTLLTNDGRLVQGVVPEQNDKVVVLQTPTERIVVDRTDIDEFTPASLSMMPEGLLESLTPAERRDLVGYLSTPSVPSRE